MRIERERILGREVEPRGCHHGGERVPERPERERPRERDDFEAAPAIDWGRFQGVDPAPEVDRDRDRGPERGEPVDHGCRAGGHDSDR